jgi:hypothetical protein
MTELAGALGAQFVLSGSIAKLGDAYQLTLQLLDSRHPGMTRRSMHLARDVTGLRDQLPIAVAEVTGTPLPPAPSHLLPYGLMVGGALGVVSGGVVALAATTTKTQYEKELSIGQQTPSVLKTYGYYTQAQQQLNVEWGIAIGVATAGAVLIATGAWLNPSEGGGVKVTLAPDARGAAVVGTW